MCIKKLISANKLCTCMVMCVAGAALGVAAAQMMVSKCCCTAELKKKAKKAFKVVEDKLTG